MNATISALPIGGDRFGRPRLEVSYLARPGSGVRAGEWALVKVRRWIRPSGSVARVKRDIHWQLSESLARTRATQLNVALLAAAADRFADGDI